MRQKELLLEQQRQLCEGSWHVRLQAQYKQMIIARQSLATTTAQCKEIGETLTDAASRASVGEGAAIEEPIFRCVLATFADYSCPAKVARGSVRLSVRRLTDEGSEGLGLRIRRCRTKIDTYKDLRQRIRKGTISVADLKVAPPEDSVPVNGTAELAPAEEKDTGAEEAPKKEELAVAPTILSGEDAKRINLPPLTQYKSPLEHMEYLE